VATVSLASAGTVALAGGGDAFWVCLPAALLACALTRTRIGAALSVTAIVACAVAPAIVDQHIRGVPSPGLALVVLIASVVVLLAVRERLRDECEALRDVALTDPLTGIANRRLLLARAEYEIARHERSRRSFAFVMLDLDGFKLLNDRFGHAAGDELLCDVAAALTRSIRAQDTVARIGGDEFCVLAPETDNRGTLPLSDRIATAIDDATAGIQTFGASIGIAIYPNDGASATALLHAADLRLLSAKRSAQQGRSSRRAA
jgi:diguanylate cyclase (GGDEF)-like protein